MHKVESTCCLKMVRLTLAASTTNHRSYVNAMSSRFDRTWLACSFQPPPVTRGQLPIQIVSQGMIGAYVSSYQRSDILACLLMIPASHCEKKAQFPQLGHSRGQVQEAWLAELLCGSVGGWVGRAACLAIWCSTVASALDTSIGLMVCFRDKPARMQAASHQTATIDPSVTFEGRLLHQCLFCRETPQYVY